jgi:hypothetical protein
MITNALRLARNTVFAFFVFLLPGSGAYADENSSLSNSQIDGEWGGIVNPYNSDCYDWKGDRLPCIFHRQYALLLLDEAIPISRFIDNNDGTVTDTLTTLIWLKNTNCFGMLDWKSTSHAVASLKDGDCGPNPDLILSDGSSAGNWRLPSMRELCTLIDYSRRDPAFPVDHKFSAVPTGYHWSATTLDSHSGMAWIVYFESGTTCYEGVTNKAGHILPVRRTME